MTLRSTTIRIVFAVLLFAFGITFVQAQDIPVRNWDVPAGELGKLATDLPAPFAAISPPCRLYDSRVSSGGPGPIPASSSRAFDFIPGGSAACGALPGNARALSLFLTVVGPLGPGFIYSFPTGSPPATPTSIINYVGEPGELRNNAAIVAVNTGTGGFTIGTGNAGTDVIIDINGIFYNSLESPDFFSQTTTRSGAAIVGINFGGTNAYGIQGSITSLAGTAASAVYGFGNVGAGNTSIVYGGNFVTDSTTTNSAAVLANVNSSTGEVHGLLGDNDSSTNGATGAWGRIGANTIAILPPATFGVLGSSINSGTANLNIGVMGVAEGGANGWAVYGQRTANSGNSIQSAGALGYSATSGVHSFDNITAVGMKLFLEPHPTDPDLEIAYVSLEGNEAGTYFRGRARFQNGLARISVPEDFRMVSEREGLGIQVTPIGEMTTVAVAKIDLDEIVVKGSRNVEFFYLVNGVRKGQSDFRPVRKNAHFKPSSAEHEMLEWNAATRQKLKANRTLSPDGRPSRETAVRLGWAAEWERIAEEARARAVSNAAQEKAAGLKP